MRELFGYFLFLFVGFVLGAILTYRERREEKDSDDIDWDNWP